VNRNSLDVISVNIRKIIRKDKENRIKDSGDKIRLYLIKDHGFGVEGILRKKSDIMF
jgi:hypothetical protein